MSPRRLVASAASLATTAAVLALVTPAEAGPLAAAETLLSGTTTAGGVGETSTTALPDGRFLTVWEGDRSITVGATQGTKGEIFGRWTDDAGVPVGEPTLLARMGAADDATQDAADPAVTTLSNGTVALVFAGDAKPDTHASGTPTDLTNWQIHAAIIDPALPLGVVTTRQLTSEGHVASPATDSDPAFDQQRPDVAEDHGRVRVVWDGDTFATGEGQSLIWTADLPLDLTGAVAPRRVDQAPAGSAYDQVRPRVAAVPGASGGSDSAVVWEGMVDRAGQPVRRAGLARVQDGAITQRAIGAASDDAAVEDLAPDVAASSDAYRVVWSSNSSGRYRLWSTALGATAEPVGSPVAITDGHHDTWSSLAFDPAQPGQYVVGWARRTSTAGTGHYEVVSGRWAASSPTPLDGVAQVSSVDGNMSLDNTESLRPATAAGASGGIHHAWSRVRSNGGAGVASRMSAALVDLRTTVVVSPARPAPARTGINPADAVTVTVSYANAAASAGSAPARLTLELPGFTASSVTPVAISGPVAVATATPGEFTLARLAPGARGTVTFVGTMDPAVEGTVRTATSRIVATALTVDDPSLDNRADAAVTIDHPPAVTGITRLDTTPHRSPVRWEVAFEEAVTGFGVDDVALTTGAGVTGSITGVACSGTACTVTATVSGVGTAGLRVPSSATATDTGPAAKPLATGNLPLLGPDYEVDTVAPTVTATLVGGDPTNDDPVEFLLDFSEPVSPPQAGLLEVTGGTLDAIVAAGGGAPPAASWRVWVTPAADGEVSLTALAGAAADAAGNPSEAGTTASATSDRTRPTLTLTGPATPQNAPYDVSVVASEQVTELTAGDLVVTGGRVGTVTGTGTVGDPWVVGVVPEVEGQVRVQAPVGAVVDRAGNTSLADSVTTTYDATRPGVTVTSAAGNPTGADPIVFTLTFTEAVTGLLVEELEVSGGTATLTGSGATRTVTVAPAADGTVSVAVPAGAAVDAAGNTSTAGAAASRVYDSTAPSPTITTTVGAVTNASSFPVTVTWTEDMVSFTQADVTLTNGTLSSWSLVGRTATFDVAPGSDGVVRVDIAAGAAEDVAGNPSAAGSLTVDYDATRPTVDLTSSEPVPTSSTDVSVTATFSEPVSGLELADLVTGNATVSNLTGGPTTYEFSLRPIADGPVTVRVAQDSARDEAGNGNAASGVWESVYDGTATADLAYSGPALVNGPVTMRITLSDDAPLTAAEIATSNATVTVTGGPRVHDLVVDPTSDGPVSVRVRAGAFTDAAGNVSAASQTVSLVHDGTAPVPQVTAPAVTHTPYDAEVVFSEPVSALDPGRVQVTNGAAGVITGSGTTWTVPIIPAADGAVSVRLLDDAARDAAGNPSVASGVRVTSYDATPPAMTLSSPSRPVVNTSPIGVEILVSEAVTGLGLDDMVVTNGTVTNLQGAGDRYTVDLVPAAEGVVSVQVRGGAAEDQSGLASLESAVLSREFDSTRPTLVLSTTTASPTREDSFAVTATFSKPVLGFAGSDVRATNATVSAFDQVDPRTWTFLVTAGGDGEVTVSVPEGAAASAGGNLAFGASLAWLVDRTAPVVTLRGPAADVTSGPVVFEVASSESISGLDAADLSVSGSARPADLAMVPVDATRWRVTVSGMAADGDVRLTVRDAAATDAAGNASAGATATVQWRRAGGRVSFALVPRPGLRQRNRVVLPVKVTGGPVTITARSSDPRLLPPAAISLAGQGDIRRLTLAGAPDRAGRSRVVVTARIGGVTRTLRLTYVVGGPGRNRLLGTRGIDVMLGRPGADTLVGRGGADHLYGGYGPDRLAGGAGRDLLVGSLGRNTVRGGSGADVFVTFGRDRLVDVTRSQGDRVVRVARGRRALLAD